MSQNYPAIDAILQRKAAIKALQQKYAADAASNSTTSSPDQTRADTRAYSGPSATLKQTVDCSTAKLRPCNPAASGSGICDRTVTSNTTAGTLTQTQGENLPLCRAARNQLGSPPAAECQGENTDRPCSSIGNLKHTRQEQVQISHSNCDSPVHILHAGQQLAADPAAAYAAEFARIRQHHQQRRSAAAVIQAAVKGWLARRYVEQITLPTVSQQQQQQQRPQQQKLKQQQDNQTHRGTPLAATVEAAEAAAVTATKAFKGVAVDDRSKIAPDAWEWKNLRRSVGLKCRQVLRQDGAYGMAAMYHRRRVEGAVLLWWRSLSRAAT